MLIPMPCAKVGKKLNLLKKLTFYTAIANRGGLTETMVPESKVKPLNFKTIPLFLHHHNWS